MGNFASSLLKKVSRPVREFNIESRIEKAITSDKPAPAPRHHVPKTQRVSNPELDKSMFEADDNLLKRLEEVYVTSTDVKGSEKENPASFRPLPSSREYLEESIYGYHEPKTIPYGKTTIKNMLEFISYHNQTPEEWSAKRIADEYKLDFGRTEKLLKYFNTYTILLPPSKTKKTRNFSVAEVRSLGARNVVELPLPPDKDKGQSTT